MTFDPSHATPLDKAHYEFSSLASHQLRTPVSGMRWIIDMLGSSKAGELTAMQKELIADAQRCIRNMNYTIHTLFLVTQLDSDSFREQPESVAVHKLVETICSKYQKYAEEREQKFSWKCPKKLVLTTDPNVLQLILDGLIDNAIKYTPNGGKIQLQIQRKRKENTVLFTVKDTGMGIPATEQERVFEKFYRGTNVVKLMKDGNGMGLYIIRRLVERLNGTLSFQSKENKGTLFRVKLPL